MASKSLHPDIALDLALAVVASSTAPLVLLDGDLEVIAASSSFYAAFQIDPASAYVSDAKPGRRVSIVHEPATTPGT